MTSDKTMVEEMARAIDAAAGFNIPRDEAVSYAQAAATIAQRRVEELREALEPFAEVAEWAERNGYDLKDFDMLLRGPGSHIAGHLQVQTDDFLKARAALNPKKARAR